MEKEQSGYKLNMGIFNGMILGLIGALVLITPFVTEVPEKMVKIDYIAGGILLAGGLISLVHGFTAEKRAPESSDK